MSVEDFYKQSYLPMVAIQYPSYGRYDSADCDPFWARIRSTKRKVIGQDYIQSGFMDGQHAEEIISNNATIRAGVYCFEYKLPVTQGFGSIGLNQGIILRGFNYNFTAEIGATVILPLIVRFDTDTRLVFDSNSVTGSWTELFITPYSEKLPYERTFNRLRYTPRGEREDIQSYGFQGSYLRQTGITNPTFSQIQDFDTSFGTKPPKDVSTPNWARGFYRKYTFGQSFDSSYYLDVENTKMESDLVLHSGEENLNGIEEQTVYRPKTQSFAGTNFMSGYTRRVSGHRFHKVGGDGRFSDLVYMPSYRPYSRAFLDSDSYINYWNADLIDAGINLNPQTTLGWPITQATSAVITLVQRVPQQKQYYLRTNDGELIEIGYKCPTVLVTFPRNGGLADNEIQIFTKDASSVGRVAISVMFLP